MDVMKKKYVKLKEENQEDLVGVPQNILTLEELQNALTKSHAHLLAQRKKQQMEVEDVDYEMLKITEMQKELEKEKQDQDTFSETLTEELREYKKSVEQLTKDKHTYEVTILNSLKTVETLKKRLIRSDQDVEQITAELEATEESKLEFEGKCNQLTDELQIICGLCDDMKEQNELALRVAGEKVVKEATLTKTNESLKAEIKKLKTVIELRQTSENTLVKQVDELREKCKIYEEYEEFACRSLLEEKNVIDIEEMQRKYLELREKYDAIEQELNETKDQNCKLRKEVAEQESLNEPFWEYLDAKEMYLKKKHYELSENKKELEMKVCSQTRTIEKLKKELQNPPEKFSNIQKTKKM